MYSPSLPTLLTILSTTLLTQLTPASPSPQQSPPTPSQTPHPPLNLTTPTNLTYPDRPGAQCRLSPNWSTPYFNAWDCIKNLESLYIHRVIGEEETKFEFMTYYGDQQQQQQKREGLVGVKLPVKWVYQSCALAIEMVNTFPPNVLVSDPAAYPASDVSTWSDISAAALAVQQRCLLSREAAGMPKWTGWSQVGASRGIGVFLWDRASFANEEYKGVGVGNGSATATLAGFSATAMAVAGGEGGDLVVNNGPVDAGLVDTS